MLWSGFFKEEITRGVQDGQGRGASSPKRPTDTTLMCELHRGPSHRRTLHVHAEVAVENNTDRDGRDRYSEVSQKANHTGLRLPRRPAVWCVREASL